MAPTTAGPCWRPILRIIASAATMLSLTAACTDKADDGEAAGGTGPRPEWCDVLESLDLPEDGPDVDYLSAPPELQDSLKFIAENQRAVLDRIEAGDATAGHETAGAVDARTTVDAWGHENCGTPDPFCSLWVSLEGLVAAGPTVVPMQFVVKTLDERLLQYAPDAHIDAVEDHLVSLHLLIDGPVPADYETGDAEAAKAELDEWVRTNC